MPKKTDELESNVTVLRRLLALVLTAGKKQREQIYLLGTAGMDRHEIAELLGTTANTVSKELSTQKKLKRKGGK